MAPKNKEIEKSTEQVTMQETIAEQDVMQEDVSGQIAKEKTWVVEVENNPEYCGVGAGGIQFANGRAVIKSERMSRWFKEHKGYSVTEQ